MGTLERVDRNWRPKQYRAVIEKSTEEVFGWYVRLQKWQDTSYGTDEYDEIIWNGVDHAYFNYVPKAYVTVYCKIWVAYKRWRFNRIERLDREWVVK